jgi:hypothetical protein
VSSCLISDVDLSGMNELVSISFQSCPAYTIDISNCTKLSAISLSSCLTSTLKNTNCPNVATLSTTQCEALGGINSFYEDYLDGSSTIMNFSSSLKTLTAENCSIFNFFGTFDTALPTDFQKLRDVDLAYNFIQSVDCFRDYHLESLILSYNPIRELTENDNGDYGEIYDYLQTLDIRFTHIDTLPSDKFTRLEEFFSESNQIETLDFSHVEVEMKCI